MVPEPSNKDKWFDQQFSKKNAFIRLFCFPYAGGNSSIYHSWDDKLPKEIELCPVQLPGRGVRFKESADSDMDHLIEAIAKVILPKMDIPSAFFGHSMGAGIAYELTQKIKQITGSEQLQYLLHILAYLDH